MPGTLDVEGRVGREWCCPGQARVPEDPEHQDRSWDKLRRGRRWFLRHRVVRLLGLLSANLLSGDGGPCASASWGQTAGGLSSPCQLRSSVRLALDWSELSPCLAPWSGERLASRSVTYLLRVGTPVAVGPIGPCPGCPTHPPARRRQVPEGSPGPAPRMRRRAVVPG